MKLNRVLIVVKPLDTPKTSTLRAQTEKFLLHSHALALMAVEEGLARLGLSFQLVPRHRIPKRLAFDLIVSIGGDGTFLVAAHQAGETPMLGVNPDPRESVGFFCAATPDTFDGIMHQVARGHMRAQKLPLIETLVDGKPLAGLALNEVLFAGRNPAETVRYLLRVGREEECQKSSGIWVSAGPGSTAAIASAGGKKLSLCSRDLQFVVREPFAGGTQRLKLRQGILRPTRKFELVSQMSHGMIYMDGMAKVVPVRRHATVNFRIADQALRVFMAKT